MKATNHSRVRLEHVLTKGKSVLAGGTSTASKESIGRDTLSKREILATSPRKADESSVASFFAAIFYSLPERANIAVASISGDQRNFYLQYPSHNTKTVRPLTDPPPRCSHESYELLKAELTATASNPAEFEAACLLAAQLAEV